MKRKILHGVSLGVSKSDLNGESIYTVMTFGSKNRKVSDFSSNQISHHVDGVDPIRASSAGMDEAICGDCDFRGVWDNEKGKMSNRMCYVNLGAGEYQKHVGFINGKYPDLTDLDDCQKKFVISSIEKWLTRFGSYGDPMSNRKVFRKLLKMVRAHNGMYTGYTNMWKNKKNHFSKSSIMASVVSKSDYDHANDLGFRTYRTKLPEDKLLPGESNCPYPKVTCDQCGLCSGTDNKTVSKFPKLSNKNLAINVHGIAPKTNAFRRYVENNE